MLPTLATSCSAIACCLLLAVRIRAHKAFRNCYLYCVYVQSHSYGVKYLACCACLWHVWSWLNVAFFPPAHFHVSVKPTSLFIYSSRVLISLHLGTISKRMKKHSFSYNYIQYWLLQLFFLSITKCIWAHRPKKLSASTAWPDHSTKCHH